MKEAKRPKGPKGQKRLKGSRGACALRLLLLSLAAIFAPPAAAAPGAPQEISSWTDLETALRTNGDYILTADVAPENAFLADALTVPADVTAALDLNGHTVDRGYREQGFDGSVIKIYGTLTLMDSAAGGAITGGFPDQFGGGVQIHSFSRASSQ